jgi:hypothetical protein
MANARYAQNWQGTSEMNHSRGFRQLFGSDSDGDAQAISDALATLTDCVPTDLRLLVPAGCWGGLSGWNIRPGKGHCTDGYGRKCYVLPA